MYRKFNRWFNRVWLKVFWVVPTIFLSLGFFIAFKFAYEDYKLLSNVANVDAPFTDTYTKWRTDGSPGQDPPK